MSKGLRFTERWLKRALWLLALIFAGFLIGLGGRIVDNLGGVSAPPTVEQFEDRAAAAAADEAIKKAERHQAEANKQRALAQLKHNTARANTAEAEDKFQSWLSTRSATARSDQDAEVIRRNKELDRLRSEERAALAAVEALDKVEVEADQALAEAQARRERVRQPAAQQAEQAYRVYELKVFGYRLALTLPLLLIAGWLFAKKRHTSWWPFVWGFIFFALFAFFVELVPYLPSYGGYVRYATGILLTLVVGRYLILALQRYLARQKETESLPDQQRRATMRYEQVLTRLANSVCPSCERKVDLKDGSIDFCPHCGIGLFDRCPKCSTRKSAFARFCFACGTPGSAALPD